MPEQKRTDLDDLLAVLPPRIQEALADRTDRDDLLEIVMDLGRKPEARFLGSEATLSTEAVTSDDLAYVVERIGAVWGRQPGGDRAHAAPHQRHPQSARRDRRPDLPGGPRGPRHGHPHPAMSSKPDARILILGRPGRGQDDPAARGGAGGGRRAGQAGGGGGYVQRDRGRRRRAASGHWAGPAHAGGATGGAASR